MNEVILIGNLTRDPETRQTKNGIPYCRFSLAVNRRKREGQNQPEADFIPILCWRNLAELCQKYLAKGRKCGVVGRLEVHSYEDQEGTKRTAFEVVADNVEFLSSRKPDEPAAGQATQSTDGYTEVTGDDLPPEFDQ